MAATSPCHGEVEAVENALVLDLDDEVVDLEHLEFRSRLLRTAGASLPFRERMGDPSAEQCWRHTPIRRLRRRPPRREAKMAQPTDPSSEIEISFSASTANSIGRCWDVLDEAVDDQRGCFLGRKSALLAIEHLILGYLRGRRLMLEHGGRVLRLDVGHRVRPRIGCR